MRYYLILIVFSMLSGHTLRGQTLAAPALLPGFDTSALQKYADDPKYQYAKKAPESSLLDRWWQAFKDKLRRIFASGSGSWHDMLYVILIAVGLVLLIYYLAKSRFQSVFRRRDDAGHVRTILDTELPATSLDVLITKAADAGDYRMAYRWAYLDLLRKLHDKGWLRLHREKTNRDYTREMDKHRMAESFAPLAGTFDRVWYGGYDLDASAFHTHRSAMHDLISETQAS